MPSRRVALVPDNIRSLLGTGTAVVHLCLAAPLAAQGTGSSARFDRTLALTSFDSAWRIVRDTHYDSTLKGLDWGVVRSELRPRAEAARTPEELRGVISEMLARLGDSHYGVIPANAVTGSAPALGSDRPGDVGIEVRLVDDRMLVTRVRPGSAAARRGVEPGWVVDRVDTLSARALVTRVRAAGRGIAARVASIRAALVVEQGFAGVAGIAVTANFLDRRDQPVRVSLVRDDVSDDVVRLGNLPPIVGRVEVEHFHTAEGCIGLVHLSAWLPTLAPRFERAMREVRDCIGIVLDLRGNLGGVAAMVMGTAGWFTSTPDTLGILKLRAMSMRYVAVPQLVTGDGRRVTPYAGPLAILVDRHTASTSEIFAARLQRRGRARVFGDTTAGQALPATFARLPDQDVLIYAVADFVTADGFRIEGRGVVPDELHPATRAALVAGDDAARSAALRWIARKRWHPVETP